MNADSIPLAPMVYRSICSNRLLLHPSSGYFRIRSFIPKSYMLGHLMFLDADWQQQPDLQAERNYYLDFSATGITFSFQIFLCAESLEHLCISHHILE